MPRTKSYRVDPDRAARAQAGTGLAPTDEILGVKPHAPSQPLAQSSESANLDMRQLLGEAARFASNHRRIDLSDWLGRGIDAWVFAVIKCLRALLLSGTRQTSTVAAYGVNASKFFAFLTDRRSEPRVPAPAALQPTHVREFVAWLESQARDRGWAKGTARSMWKTMKSVLKEMFAQGLILGEPSRFFAKNVLSWRGEKGRLTGLSDSEQERFAAALKADLVGVHHGRIALSQLDVQGLRFLVIAHRSIPNLAPLLEISRDDIAPGLLPGTIRVRTAKWRSKRVVTKVGAEGGLDLVFSLAEGALLRQALATSEELVAEAPAWCKARVWLYRFHAPASLGGSGVSSLTGSTLTGVMSRLCARHKLLGDDGLSLRLNVSRLRKAGFDRALRIADGDLHRVANLMGNTPRVAGTNYPSMNESRKAEAAVFMNVDYVAEMRLGPRFGQVILVEDSNGSDALPQNTPVSRCKDTLHGQYAPGDGANHCDRHLMCLFCSSSAIVGSVEELWRLFSFQRFATLELEFLEGLLGPERTDDDKLEDLRDRYRLVIPFIDDFVQRQFPARRIEAARGKVDAGLHPYWAYQIAIGRRARAARSG